MKKELKSDAKNIEKTGIVENKKGFIKNEHLKANKKQRNFIANTFGYLSLYFQIIFLENEGWSEEQIQKAFSSEAEESKSVEVFIKFMSKHGVDILTLILLLIFLAWYFWSVRYGGGLRQGYELIYVGVLAVLLFGAGTGKLRVLFLITAGVFIPIVIFYIMQYLLML